MIRLLARTSALMLTFAVAIMIARLVGSARPKPALYSMLFTNPDGSPCERPCMFGVRPGKMTPAEAVAILKQHPVTHGMTFREGSSETAFLDAEYEFAGENGKVIVYKADQIVFLCTSDLAKARLQSVPNLCREQESFGDVFATFGKPDGFFIEDWTNLTPSYAYYEPATVFTFYGESTDYITPNDQLMLIVVRDKTDWMTYYGYMGWHGFSNISGYLRQRKRPR
jgi:hypothetical protein